MAKRKTKTSPKSKPKATGKKKTKVVAKTKAKPAKSKATPMAKAARSKPKVAAKAKVRPKAKIGPPSKKKTTRPKLKIAINSGVRTPAKPDKLPVIIPHEEDKSLGEGLGYVPVKASTAPQPKIKIDIVPDEEDRAKGISPEYEVDPNAPPRLTPPDHPTTHFGSGTFIPDDDNRLGQHEF